MGPGTFWLPRISRMGTLLGCCSGSVFLRDPFFIRMVTFEFSVGKPPIETIPWWVFINYDISHSFISAFIVIAMVWRLNKPFAFAMLGWPFHICLDFPFHSKEFFPSKLLWPLTDFSFDGIPWNRPEIWFPNLAGIGLLFAWRYFQKK